MLLCSLRAVYNAATPLIMRNEFLMGIALYWRVLNASSTGFEGLLAAGSNATDLSLGLRHRPTRGSEVAQWFTDFQSRNEIRGPSLASSMSHAGPRKPRRSLHGLWRTRPSLMET
jgi:hypothetical protein